MHEAGIALEVIETALFRAQGARVRRVVLEVGALTAVLPDALRMAFDLAVESSPLDGAVLEIRELLAKARCRACSAELDLPRPYGACACGGTDLDFLSGDELRISEMEVE